MAHNGSIARGIHRAVSEYLTQSPSRAGRLLKTIFPAVDLVVVSGFDVFFPHDFAILTGIANLPSINMGIILDFDQQNESLFGHIKDGYDQFLSCGFEPYADEIETPDADHNLHLSRNLFHTDRRGGSSIEKPALTDQISLLRPTKSSPRGRRNCQVNQATRIEPALTGTRSDMCYLLQT